MTVWICCMRAVTVLAVFLVQIKATLIDELKLEHAGVKWEDGMHACQNLGFDGLAVFDTAKKEKELWGLLEDGSLGSDDMWVGMKYSDLLKWFAWTNGEPVQSKRWFSGEPSDLGFDNCGRIRQRSKEIGYASTECDWKKPSLCGNYSLPGEDSNNVLFQIWTNTFPSASVDSVIWGGKVRSLMECSKQLSLDQSYKFIAFDPETEHCQLLSEKFNIQNDVVFKNGAFVGVTFNDIRDTI